MDPLATETPGATMAGPFVRQADGATWFDVIPGERVSTLVRGDEVAGKYAVLTSVAQPGTATPLHSHIEDEVFHILDGVVTFLIGGTILDVPAGGTVVAPGGTAHAWKNRTDRETRMLITFVPGGIERLFEQMSGRTPDVVLPLIAQYGTVVLGAAPLDD